MYRWILVLLLACSSTDDETTSGETGSEPEDTAEVTDTGELPDGLNGTQPDAPVSLPSFAALHYDGSERGPDDLRGHPTVMWFYPFAQTYG